MALHKFSLGQRVSIGARLKRGIRGGDYTILRLLPASDSEGQKQYHIRSVLLREERVVKEGDIDD